MTCYCKWRLTWRAPFDICWADIACFRFFADFFMDKILAICPADLVSFNALDAPLGLLWPFSTVDRVNSGISCFVSPSVAAVESGTTLCTLRHFPHIQSKHPHFPLLVSFLRFGSNKCFRGHDLFDILRFLLAFFPFRPSFSFCAWHWERCSKCPGEYSHIVRHVLINLSNTLFFNRRTRILYERLSSAFPSLSARSFAFRSQNFTPSTFFCN